MVLTVTLNPLLERRISFSEIHYGSENRNGILVVKVGGKGINISRQLNKLKVDNTMLTFAGGANGKLIKDIVYKEGLKPVLIRTESESREALIFIDKNSRKITTGFSPNQEISVKESEEFKEKLLKMIPNYEIIIFSGSSPCSNTDNIFPEATKLCNEFDKVSVCDTYGNHLRNCIDAQPVIMHNNIAELQKSLGITLNSEQAIIDYLHELYSRNIKQSFITDGANSFYCSNFDFLYKTELPKITETDATGSGDAFCAGLIYGWHNDLIFDDMLKKAVSLGAANAAVFETCSVAYEEAFRFSEDVIISSVGKKMKQIDVTPL